MDLLLDQLRGLREPEFRLIGFNDALAARILCDGPGLQDDNAGIARERCSGSRIGVSKCEVEGACLFQSVYAVDHPLRIALDLVSTQLFNQLLQCHWNAPLKG